MNSEVCRGNMAGKMSRGELSPPNSTKSKTASTTEVRGCCLSLKSREGLFGAYLGFSGCGRDVLERE